MTTTPDQIVDERQRLAVRTLMTSIKAGRTPRETAIDIAAALASPFEGNKRGDAVNELESALAASGNYVADDDTYPTTVQFANGRRVSIAHAGDRAFLTVDRDDAEAERLMPRKSRLSPGRKALNEAKAASRPQEQPRKATGKMLEAADKEWARNLRLGGWTSIDMLAASINAALSVSPAAAEGWQPIETAPKDWTRILLTDGKNVVTGFWSPPLASWRCDWLVGEWGDKPTLWRPLPAAPPSPAAQEQEKPHQDQDARSPLTEARVRQIIGEYMHPKGA